MFYGLRFQQIEMLHIVDLIADVQLKLYSFSRCNPCSPLVSRLFGMFYVSEAFAIFSRLFSKALLLIGMDRCIVP